MCDENDAPKMENGGYCPGLGGKKCAGAVYSWDSSHEKMRCHLFDSCPLVDSPTGAQVYVKEWASMESLGSLKSKISKSLSRYGLGRSSRGTNAAPDNQKKATCQKKKACEIASGKNKCHTVYVGGNTCWESHAPGGGCPYENTIPFCPLLYPEVEGRDKFAERKPDPASLNPNNSIVQGVARQLLEDDYAKLFYGQLWSLHEEFKVKGMIRFPHSQMLETRKPVDPLFLTDYGKKTAPTRCCVKHADDDEGERKICKEKEGRYGEDCDMHVELFRCTSDEDCTGKPYLPGDHHICRATWERSVKEFPITKSEERNSVNQKHCTTQTFYNALKEYYDVIISAEHILDISSLNEPDHFEVVDFHLTDVDSMRMARSAHKMSPWKNLWKRTVIAGLASLDALKGTSERKPIVRLLFSNTVLKSDFQTRIAGRVFDRTPNFMVSAEKAAPRLPIAFVLVSSNLVHWNHSKIVAADFEKVISGGVNFYDFDYLIQAPVIDFSISSHGKSLAVLPHRFLDVLWASGCRQGRRQELRKFLDKRTKGRYMYFSKTYVELYSVDPGSAEGPKAQTIQNHGSILARRSASEKTTQCNPKDWSCPPSPSSLVTPTSGAVYQALSLGRVHFGIRGVIGNVQNMEGKKPGMEQVADKGLAFLLSQAKKSIRIMQQDVGPMTAALPWNTLAMEAAVKAFCDNENLQFTMLLSAPGHDAAYSNGWSLEKVTAKFWEKKPKNCNRDDARWHVHWMLQAKFSSSANQESNGDLWVDLHTRASEEYHWDTKWPDDKHQYHPWWRVNKATGADGKRLVEPDMAGWSTHHKFIAIDQKAFLVGSHNWYPAGLHEFSFIIETPATVKDVMEHWWTPLWRLSYPRRREELNKV